MKETLKKGTRIYYNGDMANEEGLGVIVEQATDAWGTWVDVKMDDGREFNKLSITIFSEEYLGHGGTRFVTEEAYRDFRQDQINKVEATLAKNDAERSTGRDVTVYHDGQLIYESRTLYSAFAKIKYRLQDTMDYDRGVITMVDNLEPVSDELDAMLVEASEEAEKRGEPDEIDDALVPKYAIQPLRTPVLLKFAKGEIDVAELARKELESRGVDVGPPPARVKKDAAIELRCKGCFCWSGEDEFKRKSDKFGKYLECPECSTWLEGDIDSRPVEKSKTVAINEFFKAKERS